VTLRREKAGVTTNESMTLAHLMAGNEAASPLTIELRPEWKNCVMQGTHESIF